MMKAGAFILTIILGVLLIQPLFAGLDTGLSGSCAQMKRATSSCCKATCHKQEPEKEKNDCGPNRCNPFMGCAAGNFYIHDYFSVTLTTIIIPRTKSALIDDNRILKQLSECWHPPEMNS
jgi:hypothetical protein